MNFIDLLLPVPRHAVFSMEGWYVWCGTLTKGPEGKYYLFFSRWPKEKGFEAWVSHSEVSYAVSDSPFGPFEYGGIALQGAGDNAWDANVIHNPSVIEWEGKYYLYYMGTKGAAKFDGQSKMGDEKWWEYRNNQRIGVAEADHPTGPWKRFEQPVLDVTPGEWDCLMTSNPSCSRGPDGRFYLLYKGVGAGLMPKGGKVLAGIAVAEHPLGPFVKKVGPVVENPENGWSVEDGFIWCQDDHFYALFKDFQGYFTRTEKNSLALFESTDGFQWQLGESPLASLRKILWEDGEVQKVHYLERPQLYIENGKPIALLCACMPIEGGETFNVQIPLRK